MKQIRIALLALAAAIAAALGSWFLANGLQSPETNDLERPAVNGAQPPAANETQPPVPDVSQAPAAEQAQIVPAAPATDSPAAKPEAAPEPPVLAPQVAPQLDPQAIAALEEKLRQATEYQPFLDKLRSLYPAEYHSALLAGAAQNMAAQDDAADLFLTEAVRQLRLKRGILGAKAGTEALDHLFDLHLAIMQKLASSDPALCVDFLNGAPADSFVAFTAAHRALMADASLAGLLAIEEGAQKKIDREAPTPIDFEALETALSANGLDKPAIALLLDGKAPNPPFSDAQTCKNGMIYLETLKSLPEPLRARLYALALEVTARE